MKTMSECDQKVALKADKNLFLLANKYLCQERNTWRIHICIYRLRLRFTQLQQAKEASLLMSPNFNPNRWRLDMS